MIDGNSLGAWVANRIVLYIIVSFGAGALFIVGAGLFVWAVV